MARDTAPEADTSASSSASISASSSFDTVVDRTRSNSMKWTFADSLLAPDEAAAEPLPMWVADTDFKAPQAVLDALHDAVDHGVLGYPGGATGGYLDAVVNWQAKRFGWEMSRDWVVPAAGVITSLKTIVQAFSAPGDSVLVQPPVYVHFHEDVRLNGRHLAYAPLERTEDGYRFDARTFEAAIRPDTKLFILSHPHNPTGNVWTEDELRTMGEICARHGVLVVSDEIHQDLVLNPARTHIPFASLGPEFARASITCTAPSKTFNLPGLQCANILIPDHRLREDFARQYERNVFPLVNVLGMVAAEAAYTRRALARGVARLSARQPRALREGGPQRHLEAARAARGRALPGVDGLPGPRDGRRGAGQVHAHRGAPVAGPGPEVRGRGPRLHESEPRLSALHGGRGDSQARRRGGRARLTARNRR